ncbi:MAG: c-type cytochrome, partial [Chloroflexota bacterium]
VGPDAVAAGQPGAAYSGTPVAPATARQLRNPVEPTEESLAIGRQIYTQNCMVCHGVQGRGDGPAARALRPPPADLAQHVTQHTDGELWWWITNGVAGTQMPAWKDVLSDTERWHVLNYIKDAFAPATG